jgi:hypothetical protein
MEKVTAYKVGTALLPTIEEAQQKELEAIIGDGAATASEAARRLLLDVQRVVDILSVPKEPVVKQRKPRKDLGCKRGPKTLTKPAQPEAGK